jgi:molybdopterin/thiamine biosynthesis adenylyltransferase
MYYKKTRMDSEESRNQIKVLKETSTNSDRFDRQKRIAGWDQKKIHNANVMVIGAGATGNEVVKNLTLCGIGTIYLIDYDIVESSNLSRCVLFNYINSLEKYKADVIKETCKNLNPEVKIIPIKQELNSIDKDLYKRSDVICSCLDNLEARLEANNYAYYYNVPFVDSGIDEFFGSVQVVYSGDKDAACLQCGISDKDLDIMWKKFSCTGQELKSTDSETERIIASIITTTSIIGGIQSQQVLKILLGLSSFKKNGNWNPNIGDPLVGKQLIYNGISNEFSIISKLKDPNCWTCSFKNKKFGGK